MNIRFDFSNMFAPAVERGITAEEWSAAAEQIPAVHKGVCGKRGENVWRGLPYEQEEILADIMALADGIRENFESFVVLGIGGSALGARALFTSLCHLRHNELPKEKRGAPKFYILDNVDPEGLSAVLDVIEPAKTCFHVITKSGNTVETMSQFMLAADLLKASIGEGYKENIVVTTDAKTGILREIVEEQGFKCYIVPEGVGGRFSVLSPVGMVAAATLGMDIPGLMKGAADMETLASSEALNENPAYQYALLQHIAMKKGANISVMMPYADSLAHFADWYAQLWAESLGKHYDVLGNEVHTGQTPVRALGVTDQHSQIQLYTEGPFDKVLTFLSVENYRSMLMIPQVDMDMKDAAYLGGQSFNKLIGAEFKATEYAVTKAGKMNMNITLSEVNAYTIGALLLFFEMATAAAGELLGIDAFDQPGVEEGKIATFALMGREGYEEKAEALECGGAKGAKWVFEF